METQPITAVDIAHGRVRIPITGDAKAIFPRTKGPLQVVFLGEPMEVNYDPRLGPDKERSGVLRLGRERLTAVTPGERLPISVDRQRRVVIGGQLVATKRSQVQDSAGHAYEEFQMSKTEFIRLTYIPHQEWAAGPTIRIQKRDFRGRIVPGPEFPAAYAGDLARSLINLLDRRYPALELADHN